MHTAGMALMVLLMAQHRGVGWGRRSFQLHGVHAAGCWGHAACPQADCGGHNLPADDERRVKGCATYALAGSGASGQGRTREQRAVFPTLTNEGHADGASVLCTLCAANPHPITHGSPQALLAISYVDNHLAAGVWGE